MSTSRFPLVEYDDASSEVREIYDDILKYHSFLPNWFKSQGGNPNILRGNWMKVKLNLFSGMVPLILKQMILVSISRARDCAYCTAIHGHSLKTLSAEFNDGVPFGLDEDLHHPLVPASYQVALDVVTRIGMDPYRTHQEDFDLLAEEGFSTAEIQELAGVAGLAIFVNTYADISGVPIDLEVAHLN